ncbi:MAG: hypothetical protein AAF614_08800 [Chloroflexota bacterium]
MLQELFSSGSLNFIYSIVVLISFIFALVTLLGAGFGDALDFDADIDADSGLDFVSISPFALAMFGAFFGLTGLITRLWLEMDAIPSILWAAGVGFVFGAAAQALFLYVLSPSKSSHYSLAEDAGGRQVEVIVTIPKGGVGKIAYDNATGRVTLGARSANGKQIGRGQFAKVEKINGRIAVVRTEE